MCARFIGGDASRSEVVRGRNTRVVRLRRESLGNAPGPEMIEIRCLRYVGKKGMSRYLGGLGPLSPF